MPITSIQRDNEIGSPLVPIIAKGLRFGFLNVNRLFNKISDIENLLSTYAFDILFIAETWLSNIITDIMVSVPDYNFYRSDRTYSNGGGLICYFKQCNKVMLHSCSCSPNLERLSVNFYLPNNQCIFLTAIYRKPSSTSDFFSEFYDFLDSGANRSNSYIFGDFNIDLNSSTATTCNLKRLCSQYKLLQIIQDPTHNSALIDHIYTSNSLFVGSHGVIPISFSDHALVYVHHKRIKSKCKGSPSTPALINCLDFRHFDPANFCTTLSLLISAFASPLLIQVSLMLVSILLPFLIIVLLSSSPLV